VIARRSAELQRVAATRARVLPVALTATETRAGIEGILMRPGRRGVYRVGRADIRRDTWGRSSTGRVVRSR
jgi:hypothetical protein